MNDVVEVVSGNSGKGVLSSEDTQLDLFFKMHEKINAKNEEISKSYNNNILVEFKDIQELHFKTIQSIESLNPAKSNIGIRIAVSHNEGESEKFNSFEEFESHNKTSPNPTSNILMTYTFTLYDPDRDLFENYKVVNLIRSRVAELEQIEKEAPNFISKAIISGLVTTTAMITIEYSDYVKARHFTAMFDEWVKGCDESKSSRVIKLLKRVSHLITISGLLIIYALMAIFTVSAIDADLISGDLIIKFAVTYTSIFLIIRSLCNLFLKKIEYSIDSYLAISYLNINKGDAKIIKQYSNRNRSSMIWATIGVLGTITIGVLTNSVYDFIKWFLMG